MFNRFVEVEGIHVFFSELGEGEPVLLLHGCPDSRRSWSPLMQALAEERRLVAPDFPGFGDSAAFLDEVPLDPQTMERFWKKFVHSTFASEPVHVVVHDFGAPWLLPWVISEPKRVRSLVVLNSTFQGDYRWHFWARIMQRPLLGELTLLALRRPGFRRRMAHEAPGVERSVVDEVYSQMHPTMRRTMLRVYRTYADPRRHFEPWEHKLLSATTRIPTKVLWGDKDEYIPRRFADRFGGEVTHLEDLGHWPHLQDPMLIAHQLRAFWSSLASSSSAA